MTYLHTYNPPIIHRDLKSPNLLVDENMVSDDDDTTSRPSPPFAHVRVVSMCLCVRTALTLRAGHACLWWFDVAYVRSRLSRWATLGSQD